MVMLSRVAIRTDKQISVASYNEVLFLILIKVLFNQGGEITLYSKGKY